MKIDCPNVNEIERTKEIFNLFNNENREETTKVYFKCDVVLLICVFENFIKVSINEFGTNPLYCVNLPDYTWQFGLKYTGINSQKHQKKRKNFVNREYF